MRKFVPLFILFLILLKAGDFLLVRMNDQSMFDEECSSCFYDYVPYTGFHLIANKKIEKTEDAPTLNYDDLDLETGDRGFFVDFDLDRPPEKGPGEFRLILTGSSTAQGFGVPTKDKMFYRLLEKAVNRKLAALGSKKSLRVVNLGMASANSFQNFIALNRWAHKMEPDAIMSLSGVNDFEADQGMHEGGFGIGGFIYSQRPSRDSWLLKGLSSTFPGIFRSSVIGQAIRSFRIGAETMRYRDDNMAPQNAEEHLRSSVEFYTHSLKSITRDFPAIPLLLVLQPAAKTTDVDEFYEASTTALESEVRVGVIRILNARTLWTKNGFYPGSFVDDRHLSSQGNLLLTDFVADEVVKVIQAGKK